MRRAIADHEHPHLAVAPEAQRAPVPATRVPGPMVGRSAAIGHHGETLQGVFEQRSGVLVRGLVTLRARLFRAKARFEPRGHGELCVKPRYKIKAQRAAELTLARLGQPCARLLKIDSKIPTRWGLGSSTGDVVAVVRAIGATFSIRLSPEEIAEIAVRAETASDSTMFGDRAILFAQRRGIVIADLGGHLPPVHVVGFNLDPRGVDTLTRVS